jgi:outer membrane receptor protein involved in Fe transport
LETQFAPFKIQSERTEGKILIDYNPNTQFNLLAGTSLFKDEATQKLPRQIFNSTQTTTLSYTNYSAFAQIMAKTGIANFAAGARYNTNSIYPPSFVPRLSVTKTFGKAHIKILYSKAFRAPNTENIDLNNAIKPENTTVAEIETGIHIGSHLSISTNAFYIQTRDPIIYYYDQPNDRDAYINLDKMGTRGFEAELKYKLQKQFASINYSFYTALNQDDRLSVYMVPQNRNAFLAFPQHKLYIYGGRELAKELYINMAISIYGPRYAIFQIDENGEPVYTNIPAKAYTSIYINKANCFTKNMAASVGVNNLFDEQQWYIQPYNSLHAPLPGLSRQFVIKVSYSFSNKK